MADLLNVASSALLSYRRALDTIGHNIANVNTPGYSRQSVELAAREGAPNGGGFIGSGVSAIGVNRLQDPFVADRLLASIAQQGQVGQLADVAARVDRLLSDEATGLAAPLRQFLAAAEGVAADPSSAAAREVLLSDAETLATRFRQLSGNLDNQAGEIDRRLGATVDEINNLSQSIAELNVSIVRETGAAGGQPPNDLLDRRDELVRQLSERVGVNTQLQDDGALNVFGAGGQPLVLGSTAGRLSVGQGAFGAAGGADVFFSNDAGQVRITGQIDGGRLGGLLDARDSVIAPARGELDRLAAAIAHLSNTQQAAGADLRGQPGEPLFAAPQPEVAPRQGNSAGIGVTATLADPAALSGREYELRFDGSLWQLRDAASGDSVTLAGSGTAGDPFTAEGLSLVIGGTPAAGDAFRIRPAGASALNMAVVLDDASGVAAAARVGVRAAADNAGPATASLSVIDNADPALTDSVTIEFLSANQYTLNGSPPIAFNPGDTISFNGLELALDGSPVTGDRYLVDATPPNSGDNSNARALTAALGGGFFDGGATSIQNANSQLLGQVGGRAQRAEQQASAFAAIVDQDRSALESVSGVNLDEEAADLLRYEQAYQAAARVIQTADSLFQTLLSVIR